MTIPNARNAGNRWHLKADVIFAVRAAIQNAAKDKFQKQDACILLFFYVFLFEVDFLR